MHGRRAAEKQEIEQLRNLGKASGKKKKENLEGVSWAHDVFGS